MSLLTVGTLPVPPRPVATVAALGCLSSALSQVHPHALGWVPWDTKASLSLGQTTGVRGTVELATGGQGAAKSPPLLPLREGLEDSVNVATLRGTQGKAGPSGRGMPGPIAWLPAQQLGQGRPGSGSVNPPHLPKGWGPHHNAKQGLPVQLSPCGARPPSPGQPHGRLC